MAAQAQEIDKAGKGKNFYSLAKFISSEANGGSPKKSNREDLKPLALKALGKAQVSKKQPLHSERAPIPRKEKKSRPDKSSMTQSSGFNASCTIQKSAHSSSTGQKHSTKTRSRVKP
mmetsp:Transcript_1390/g.1840  ORF Transcript_1390/g.1840 Transcript_1390/m.1840 type:complete len:117 (+) Transcript_1390:2358-2708(+)